MRDFSALPTELQDIATPAGLEPATALLAGEVSHSYAIGKLKYQGINK